MTSRGSRVSSAARRCRTASRTTSTWRARPWQAWIWSDRSAGSSAGRSSSAPGYGDSRRRAVGADAGLEQSQEISSSEAAGSTGRCSPPATPWAARTSCISRASRPQERSSGLAARPAVGSPARSRSGRRAGGDRGHPRPRAGRRGGAGKGAPPDPGPRLEDSQVAGRKASQTEYRHPLRQFEQIRARRPDGGPLRRIAQRGWAPPAGTGAAATDGLARPASGRHRPSTPAPAAHDLTRSGRCTA